MRWEAPSFNAQLCQKEAGCQEVSHLGKLEIDAKSSSALLFTSTKVPRTDCISPETILWLRGGCRFDDEEGRKLFERSFPEAMVLNPQNSPKPQE